VEFPDEVPPWNSGRRESAWVKGVEEPRLRADLHELEQLESRLRYRYGLHWPKGPLRIFADRQQALYDELDQMESAREEPWFPELLVQEIRRTTRVADTDLPQLVESLWKALQSLKTAREDVERGRNSLDAQQRTKLRTVERSLGAFLKACGPDVSKTQPLIGGWASGLLNGQTLGDLVKSASVLSIEISMRTSRALGVEVRTGRPREAARERFCLDVAIALRDARVHLRVYREGILARVLRLLLSAAGEPQVTDLLRIVQKAVRQIPAEDKRRQQSRARLSRFLKGEPRRQRARARA